VLYSKSDKVLLNLEKVNPPRGGGAKSWICPHTDHVTATYQTARLPKVFSFGGFVLRKEVIGEKIYFGLGYHSKNVQY